MPAEIEQVETQLNDVNPTDDVATTTPPNDQPEEPFLRVNDRTVYKSKDDAVRAYDEAGKRIASLTAWEKAAKGYGIDRPEVLTSIFDETLSLREKVKELEKLQAKPNAQPTQSDPETPEDKKALAYLKNVLPKLGYVPKEELEPLANEIKELKEQLESVKSSTTQSEEQRFRTQEATLQDELNTWVKSEYGDEKFDKRGALVGTLIRNWINADDDLIARWRQGGVEARNLIREGYDLFKAELPWPKSTVQPGASASTAASKGRAVTGNKKLPNEGTVNGKAKKEEPKPGDKDYWTNLHNRARDFFESKLAEQ